MFAFCCIPLETNRQQVQNALGYIKNQGKNSLVLLLFLELWQQIFGWRRMPPVHSTFLESTHLAMRMLSRVYDINIVFMSTWIFSKHCSVICARCSVCVHVAYPVCTKACSVTIQSMRHKAREDSPTRSCTAVALILHRCTQHA